MAVNNEQYALEFRKAVQLFLRTLDAETQAETMMEVASIFPKYEVGKSYKTKDVFSYGENSVGDPQLYVVLSGHTSADEWTPDTATSLYKAIGITEEGVAVWVQPLGATDAYNTGDKVSHGDAIWVSTVDGNTWEPGVYGWEVAT